MGYSLRTDRFRYTEWRVFRSPKILARELYDHQADPEETKNLASDKAFSETMEKLHGQLSKLIDR